MAQRVALDPEEPAAPAGVQPPLEMPAERVVAPVHVAGELLERASRCRAHSRGIAAVVKLHFVARTAPGTGDSQHGAASVQPGERTRAALVHGAPRGEALQV